MYFGLQMRNAFRNKQNVDTKQQRLHLSLQQGLHLSLRRVFHIKNLLS